jgi:hypothetical protein
MLFNYFAIEWLFLAFILILGSFIFYDASTFIYESEFINFMVAPLAGAISYIILRTLGKTPIGIGPPNSPACKEHIILSGMTATIITLIWSYPYYSYLFF